ncbi:MAG: hypothetical protein R3185_07690, partial [Candidatus Thermoplasmatota archaeon]|nr:hypothetical protein [Candidatus Thermoplasmatota archaeon]
MVVTVAMVPVATAGWRNWVYDGNEEPTVGDPALESWDYDSSKMWQDANQGADDQVYFDLVIDNTLFPFVPHLNPDGWQTRQYVVTVPHFYLGYWRDCNGDSFIGDATTGAIHYPAEVARAQNPNADEVCPPGSPYQDDAQVNEFLAIGPGVRDIGEQDITGGSDDPVLCPDRNGGPTGDTAHTPRADENSGVGDGGDNVACFGDRAEYAQDDFAKVWFDLGLPIDDNKPTSTFFPF